MLFCFVSNQTFHCTSSTEAVGGGDVQGSGVRCTTGVRGACLVELCAKGAFSGAELGTQSLGRKWLKGAQSPHGRAFT